MLAASFYGLLPWSARFVSFCVYWKLILMCFLIWSFKIWGENVNASSAVGTFKSV